MINLIIKWSALVFTVIATLCTSLRIDPLNIYLTGMGCFLYFLWATRIKDLNIALVNLFLMFMCFIGLFFHR